MSDMRRLIEAVDTATSKTKVDEALPLVGAGLAAAARVAAPYVARAGGAIMKGIKGPAKPPVTPPKPPVTPPVTTPAGSTPPIPANVNIPAVVRNKPAAPPASTPPSAPASPATAGAKPPAKTNATPAVTKPKIERRPGETTADAVKRAQVEKGTAPKPAAPAAPAAPKPAVSDKPAVWRDPRTGEISSTPPGAGRPVTSPAAPKPAEPAVPAAPKPATGKDPVGSARPGGERDTLGRKEPSFGKKDPDPVGNYKPKPDDMPIRPPAPAKPQNLKKPAIAAAAAAASLYPTELNKDKIPTTTGSAGAAQPPATANGQPQVDSTPSPTKIDLPTVGPQGADSPFYVVPTDTTPKPPAPAPVAPAPTPIAPSPAPAIKPPAPAPVAPAPAPAPIAPSPAPAIKPSAPVIPAPAPAPIAPGPVATKPPAATVPSSTAAVSGNETGTGSGSDTGYSSRDGDSIETRLRKNKYIKETAVQKLLNNFTKFIESSTKNKSKAK